MGLILSLKVKFNFMRCRLENFRIGFSKIIEMRLSNAFFWHILHEGGSRQQSSAPQLWSLQSKQHIFTLSTVSLQIFGGMPASGHWGSVCPGRAPGTSSTYWSWSIDDGDVVTVLESASNPSSTYCQDQDPALKLKKMDRKQMAFLHRTKWLSRHLARSHFG